MKAFLAALLAAPFLCATAIAGPPLEAPIAVQSADLDIGTEADASILLARLERAAERFCEADLMAQARHALPAIRSCRAEAVAKTVARINAPMLTTVYAKSRARFVRMQTAAIS